LRLGLSLVGRPIAAQRLVEGDGVLVSGRPGLNQGDASLGQGGLGRQQREGADLAVSEIFALYPQRVGRRRVGGIGVFQGARIIDDPLEHVGRAL
jgi:hypothetical protein